MEKISRTFQALLPRSLRMRLLVFLLAAIVLAGAVQGALAYRGALEEADALFDYHMQQTALALRSGLPVDAQGLGPGLDPEDENNEFIVQVWTNEGLRIFESAVGAALPQIAVLGFTNVQARGGTYRVFSMQTRSQVIQVAQNMAARRAGADEESIVALGEHGLKAVDPVVEMGGHAHLEDVIDLGGQHRIRQAEGGQLAAHEAATQGLIIKEINLVTQHHQIPRHGQ